MNKLSILLLGNLYLSAMENQTPPSPIFYFIPEESPQFTSLAPSNSTRPGRLGLLSFSPIDNKSMANATQEEDDPIEPPAKQRRII